MPIELARAHGCVVDRLVRSTGATNGRNSAHVVTIDDTQRLGAVRRSGLHSHDVRGYLDNLSQLAARLCGAPVALVSIVDDHRQYFAGMSGLESEVADRRETPLAASVCQTVVNRETPLVIDNLALDERFETHQARDDLNVESYCGVPIRDGDGHVLGSFCVVDDEAHTWSPEVVDVLERLADLVTDQVSVSRDYLSLVSDLQSRVVPAILPDPPTGRLVGRYRAVLDTDQVGGDFFDARQGADGTYLVVGDVVGHGIKSTHAAAQLRAALRALCTSAATSPDRVIGELADACADLPGCACAGVLVAKIATDGRKVEWARAGAMPPVIVSARAGTATIRHEVAGAPLGVGAPEATGCGAAVMEPGDTFIAYTDGLVERRHGAIDDGLAELAANAANHGNIDDLIAATCPIDEQRDDIAVVVWTA